MPAAPASTSARSAKVIFGCRSRFAAGITGYAVGKALNLINELFLALQERHPEYLDRAIRDFDGVRLQGARIALGRGGELLDVVRATRHGVGDVVANVVALAAKIVAKLAR